MDTLRAPNGQFLPGTAPGPGRERKLSAEELDYVQLLHVARGFDPVEQYQMLQRVSDLAVVAGVSPDEAVRDAAKQWLELQSEARVTLASLLRLRGVSLGGQVTVG